MLTIRRAQHTDGPGIYQAHTRAIRETCRSHYTPEEVEVWAGRLRPDSYQAVIASRELFVAEERGEILGFGQLNVESGEVEAVYVLPTAGRKGVGTQLLRTLEERARQHAVLALHLDASLNAVPFYTHAGYVPVREAKHRLRADVEIACVVMEKGLTS